MEMRRDKQRGFPIKHRRGAALVEFALVSTLLLMLVFGMIDFGLAFSDLLALNQIAREAARSAALGGSAQAAVTDWAGRLHLKTEQIQVTSTVEGTTTDPRVVVTLTYPHQWISGKLLGLQDRNLVATMVMRKE